MTSIHQPVHRQFEIAAEAFSDRPAVTFHGDSLSYDSLNRRANRLARLLREAGVSRGTRVAISLGRGLDWAVAIFGVLKAGGCYVPLDPEYPLSRVEYMLANSGARLLITDASPDVALPAGDFESIRMDDAVLAGFDDSNLGVPVSIDDDCYIMYTSGSTGTPKGVLATQFLTNVDLEANARVAGVDLGFSPEDRYLHSASFAFASSVRQLFVPLMHGAAVVIAGGTDRRSPRRFLELIREGKVTVIDIVPSFWRSLADYLDSVQPTERRGLLDNRLRLILSASEPLLNDVLHRWRVKFHHPARLINMFGHTETTGIVLIHEVLSTVPEPSPVPLGKPAGEARIHLLDEDLKPAAAGESGELFIECPGLAREYVDLPELTASKFLTDPFKDGRVARLYRTGDLAQKRPDGSYVFTGRADQQVKIRGFRVETGEVEVVLRSHPNVQEAYVLARGAEGADRSLVAYVVPRPATTFGRQTARTHLRQSLPDYMIPQEFVILSGMPMTPTGKVNRAALLELREEGAGALDPLLPIESAVASIWADVLGRGPASAADNFFEIGGDSLQATRVASRLEAKFNIAVPIEQLFQRATVAAMAGLVLEALASRVSRAELTQILVEIGGQL